MTDPVRTIAERVRTRVLRDGVDLATDSSLASRYADEEVRRYSERALGGAHAQLGDERGTAREVVASLTGYGPLQPFFDDRPSRRSGSMRRPGSSSPVTVWPS